MFSRASSSKWVQIVPLNALWRQRVGRQARSGLTIAQFCAQERLPVKSFYAWKRRLRLIDLADHRLPSPAPSAFLPVTLRVVEPQISVNNGTHYTGDQAAIAQGDNFLSIVVPMIMNSAAYKNNGAIVIWCVWLAKSITAAVVVWPGLTLTSIKASNRMSGRLSNGPVGSLPLRSIPKT
jgi:hypothetical protein